MHSDLPRRGNIYPLFPPANQLPLLGAKQEGRSIPNVPPANVVLHRGVHDIFSEPSFRSHERIRDDRSDYRFIGYGILFALVAVLLATGGAL